MKNASSLSAIFVTSEYPGSNLPLGGLATYVHKTARELAKAGHSIAVIHPCTKPRREMIDGVLAIGVPIVHGYMRRLLSKLLKPVGLHNVIDAIERSYVLCRAANALVTERKVDIIQYSSYLSVGLFRVARVASIGRLSSLQVECDAAIGASGKLWCRIMQRLEISTLRRMNLLIGPSEAVNGRARHMLSRPIMTVETMAAPYDDVIEQSARQKIGAATYILYFGTIGRLKGTDRLARVAPLLAAWPELRLVIAGKAPGDNLRIVDQIRAAAGDHADRVMHLGELTRAQLEPVIHDASVVMLPSRADNLPNACVEAMMHARPVIACRDASFEQLIRHGESGFLVAQDDGQDLAAAVSHCLSLPQEERDRIGEAARARTARLAPEHALPALLLAWEHAIKKASLTHLREAT